MGTIGLAIVGCGQFARAHLGAINEVEGAVLTAAVDVDEERARKVAEAIPGASWTTVYDEALSDPKVDAVVLALPHDLHLPFSVKAAEAGKHILVEKPMALSEAEGLQMVSAAEGAGVQLMVGQSTRFGASVQRAHALLREGAVGEIVNVLHQKMFWVSKLSTDWRRDPKSCGGLYLPLFGSHDVDAVLWLLDDSPTKVWASIRSSSSLSDGDSDGFIGMDFADGKVASIAFSCQAKRSRSETVFVGREGTLAVTQGALLLNEEPVELPSGPGSVTLQMQAFVKALADGSEVPTPGRQVLRVLRVLDLARESSNSGIAVTF